MSSEVKALGRKPDFVIGDPGNPYLLRWWVIPRNPWFNIYLHKILRPDNDRALHDHPWWNLSIILRGGYYEHMPPKPGSRAKARTAWRKPGSLTLRRAKAAHRLSLPIFASGRTPEGLGVVYQPCWTLFITGPRIREWGFYCPKGWVRWQDFVDRSDTGSVGRGCGEHG